ncbi:STAS domain-containing protein [Bacillus massiliglaciei]|uniref:STAS domain-containing protein n=1 Tax=Bacillus massiliglaciei TaxID=1816693 RepID=UPI000AF18D00|nr:STAS domain-containing protein [Bacillus massiliglaciei]
MTNMNERLNQYMLDHSGDVTEKWLEFREKKDGTLYAKNADKELEALLKEQNTLTNKTVSSALLEDRETFRKNKEEWVQIVAKSRVESNTPVYEVLDALSKARKAYWAFVAEFAETEKVRKEDVVVWSGLIHEAFDELNREFAQQYYVLTNQCLMSQQELISELSIPVIPIIEGIGVLPIIGEIDTHRANHILENTPAKCVSLKITHLFIDLSGVSFLDTMVAHQIFHLTSALRLLGVKTTISGIRPEVAQTSVQLGLDFSQISTHSTLKQAFSRLGIHLEQK